MNPAAEGRVIGWKVFNISKLLKFLYAPVISHKVTDMRKLHHLLSCNAYGCGNIRRICQLYKAEDHSHVPDRDPLIPGKDGKISFKYVQIERHVPISIFETMRLFPISYSTMCRQFLSDLTYRLYANSEVCPAMPL